MRSLMNEIGPTYAPSVQLGEPIAGGTVNRVVASKDSHWLWVGLLAAGSLIAVFQGEPAGLIGDGLGREEAGLIW
jgi:hypothetical protein